MKDIGKGIAVAATALAAFGAIAIIKDPVSLYALFAPVAVALLAWINDNGD